MPEANTGINKTYRACIGPPQRIEDDKPDHPTGSTSHHAQAAMRQPQCDHLTSDHGNRILRESPNRAQASSASDARRPCDTGVMRTDERGTLIREVRRRLVRE